MRKSKGNRETHLKDNKSIQRPILNGLFYSSIAISMSLPYQYFSARYIHFYTQELKAAPFLVSIVLIIYGLWNAVNDPLLGWLSDRTRTRLGKRFPYILSGFIPLSLSFIAVWLPPDSWIGKDTILFIYMICTFFLFDSFYTLVILNWTALFPEKYQKIKQRNYISAARQVFSVIGIVGAFIIPPIIIGEYGNLSRYRIVGYILGGITFLNLGLGLFACRDSTTRATEAENYSLKTIKDLFSNRSFLAYLFSNMCLNLGFVSLMGALPFYNQWILEKKASFETILNAASIGTALLVLFIWAYIANKIGAKHVFTLGSLIATLSFLSLFFFDKNNANIIFIPLVFVGIGIGGLLMIVDILLANIIDEDLLNHGFHREGLFFGGNGFAIRIAIAIQGVIFGFVTNITGFDPDLTTQSSKALLGIKILFIIIPIISLVLGSLILFLFYDLDKEKVALIKSKLQAKKQTIEE
ncbi:MAG: MFS transporter [Candidatus Heimdallarchaeota archaeon]|nr:MFS transporter [Candidatus Heimdallarchaeota archaeon]